ELRPSQDESEHKPDHAAHRIADRDLAEGDRYVPVDILVTQQIHQSRENQAWPAEIRQHRIADAELPGAQDDGQDADLCDENLRAAGTTLAPCGRDLCRRSFNAHESLVPRAGLDQFALLPKKAPFSSLMS